MTRLLESIRCQDGQLENLIYHQKRVERSFTHFFPGISPLLLSEITVPIKARKGLFKCRLIYTQKIEEIRFIPYRIRPVNSLQLVQANELDYPHKFANRTDLNELFSRRGNADDVLIIKNGLITDTTYANVALYDGREWYTPAQPLLAGTQREKMIVKQVIHQADITVADLQGFNELRLFNAMIPFESGHSITLSNIRY